MFPVQEIYQGRVWIPGLQFLDDLLNWIHTTSIKIRITQYIFTILIKISPKIYLRNSLVKNLGKIFGHR